MKISVALATYNGEDYIIEQLDSILAQSVQPDEVIICDDVSSDKTVEIIKEYIKKNNLQKKWKINFNKYNLGYADNFYNALKMSSGDYIFLCDQDDIWMHDRIERMIEVMENNNNIFLLGSEYEPFYMTKNAPKISRKILDAMIDDDSLEHIHLNERTIFLGSEGCTMCIRKSFFHQIEQYWYSGFPHDEYLWKMALCLNGCYIHHYKSLRRRFHDNNVSKKKIHDKLKRITFLENLLRSHKAMLLLAIDLNLEEFSKNLIENNIKSVEMRIDLIKNKKILKIIPLILFYNKYFYSKKSLLVELKLALMH